MELKSDFQQLTDAIAQIFETDPKLVLVYVVIYSLWGVAMNNVGIYSRIAKFKNWWQIITCYVLYMIPVSLLLKELPWYQQYAYGLFFMGIIEFGGYTIGSSITYQNNILDRLFTPHNFALGMTLFFATYFPIGNWAVEKVYGWVF